MDTEDFAWLNDLRWTFNGKYIVLAGKVPKPMYLHNVIQMAYDVNLADGLCTDHINRNRFDCRKKNLRRITRQQNTWNRSQQCQVKKFIGVRKYGKKWVATIQKHRKGVYLYYGDSELEAAKAYDKEVKKDRGEFAVTNF